MAWIALWIDENKSYSTNRKGNVRYKGKVVFDTLEEAQEAVEFDREEEIYHYPQTQMTWVIYRLPKPR